MADPDATQKSIAEWFKQFNEAQQKRPAIYKKMQQAFENRHKMCSHDYADQNKEITNQHVAASKSIIQVASTFEAMDVTHTAAGLIRSLQLLEKEKLQATIAWYISQQKYLDGVEDHTGYEEAEFESASDATSRNLKKLIGKINDILEEIKEEEVKLVLSP